MERLGLFAHMGKPLKKIMIGVIVLVTLTILTDYGRKTIKNKNTKAQQRLNHTPNPPTVARCFSQTVGIHATRKIACLKAGGSLHGKPRLSSLRGSRGFPHGCQRPMFTDNSSASSLSCLSSCFQIK